MTKEMDIPKENTEVIQKIIATQSSVYFEDWGNKGKFSIWSESRGSAEAPHETQIQTPQREFSRS